MKSIIQRVSSAKVIINNKEVAKIKKGFLVLLGIHKNDTEKDINWLVEKTINLRIIGDSKGKMNKSLKDINGEILIVPQFTLYANCRKGTRPSFTNAAQPQKAKKLYQLFVKKISSCFPKVQTGIFGATMDIKLVNNGPVTIILDSKVKK